MTAKFNPLDHPVCLELPNRLVFPNSWVTHIPFAMYLISALSPEIFVELGTHTGNSYCGFCQAVDSVHIPTRCYAIDTWQGDDHAGFYDESVYKDLKAFHDPLYGSFSRLMRMTFDQAVEYFSDGTIGLLHIDGLHTYDAVKHDFYNWLPKLTSDAVVIFHDINVKEREFGVWKFWEEISKQCPSLEFFHGNGLGVISSGETMPSEIKHLFNPENQEEIRYFFAQYGEWLNYPVERLSLLQLLSEKDVLLSNKSSDIESLSKSLNENEINIGLLENRNRRLTDENRSLEDKIKVLHGQVEQLAGENTSLHLSNSFKLTRPFRKIRRLLKGE